MGVLGARQEVVTVGVVMETAGWELTLLPTGFYAANVRAYPADSSANYEALKQTTQ